MEGLLGIINDRSLWASCPIFMNDHEELAKGIEYGVRWLEVNEDRLIRKIGSDEFEKIKRIFEENLSTAVDIYVCCFSTKEDSLSQWRAYSRGGGVAIVFPRDFIEKKIRNLNLSDISLQKCCYRHSSEDNPVRTLLDQIGDLDGVSIIGNGPAMERYRKDLIKGARTAAVTVKNSGFAEEDEWRIVKPAGYDKGLERKFRVRREYIVPYIKLKLLLNENNEDDVGGIRILGGPSSDKLAKMRAICLLWNKTFNTGKQCPYDSSKISYRE